MSLRETFSNLPFRGMAVAVGVVVIGIVAILIEMPSGNAPPSISQSFYTIDDGKTWFPDDVNKLPPFDKDGKPAVRAYVYRAPDGTQFVNYLERLKPDAKRILEAANNPDGKTAPGLMAIQTASASGREVKRPGDAKWVSIDNHQAAGKVMAVKTPTGNSQATEVQP